MVRDAKQGGAPTLDRMAAFAAAAIRAFCKLAAMRIGVVAIGALIVSDRSFEIACLVTGQARDIYVLPEQREVCLRVIEGCGKARFLPGSGGVAGLAALLECAFMRIAMAVGTG